VVLDNLGDQPYRVEKGDRIAELIIEIFDNRELQEVTQLDDTERGDPGFGSSNTTMDQKVTGQKAKIHIGINEISARAFGQFYRRGETTGSLRWDEIEAEIQLEAINISTELALTCKKNNEDQDVSDTVPQEYHYLLDVFEKRRKNKGTPSPTRHRSRNRSGRRKDSTNEEDIRPELLAAAGTPPIQQRERRSRMAPKGKVGTGHTNYVCQEKGWQTQTLRRLSGAQWSPQKGSTPATAY